MQLTLRKRSTIADHNLDKITSKITSTAGATSSGTAMDFYFGRDLDERVLQKSCKVQLDNPACLTEGELIEELIEETLAEMAY